MRLLALLCLAAAAVPAFAGNDPSSRLEEMIGGKFADAAASAAGKAVSAAAVRSAAHFNADGSFSRWSGSPSWDAPVLVDGAVLLNNASDKRGPISVRDFLNRAHRVYAEGKGNFADQYAHAQDNVRRKKGGAEKDNFSGMSNYEKKLDEGEGAFPSYAAFFEAKKDLQLSKLNGLSGAGAALKAEIDLLTGLSDDPTNGATQWRGAELSAYDGKKDALERAKKDVTVLEGWGLSGVYVKDYRLLKGDARLHIFFSVTNTPPD